MVRSESPSAAGGESGQTGLDGASEEACRANSGGPNGLVQAPVRMHTGVVMRPRWYWLILFGGVLPLTVRADGIDLPILFSLGVGVVLPLLLFNATIEAPILGRLLRVRWRELWPWWFKANVWSLLAGIPAWMICGILDERFLPAELGHRFRVYPWFLLLHVGVYFVATCLTEALYTRKIVRETELKADWRALIRAVVIANLASYAVLGPAYVAMAWPKADVQEFAADTRWTKQPELTVVAVGPGGQLEAATADGRNRRVVVPHEVRDYVVSADLRQVLYRGKEDRYFFYQNGTNRAIPDPGFRCLAPGMDFSPSGSRVAFCDSNKLRIYECQTDHWTDLTMDSGGSMNTLAWSTEEDRLYFCPRLQWTAVTLQPTVVRRSLTDAPNDFAGHYGKIGNVWSRDGAYYGTHRRGELKVSAYGPAVKRLWVSKAGQTALKFNDPAGSLFFEQAAFVGDFDEILTEGGGYVYLLDVTAKRLGPVMQGSTCIALAPPFLKHGDF